MIHTVCPKCGAARDFEDQHRGRTFRCPKCSSPVRIEDAGESAPVETSAFGESAPPPANNHGESAPVSQPVAETAPAVATPETSTQDASPPASGSTPLPASENKSQGCVVWVVIAVLVYWFSDAFPDVGWLGWVIVIGVIVYLAKKMGKKG